MDKELKNGEMVLMSIHTVTVIKRSEFLKILLKFYSVSLSLALRTVSDMMENAPKRGHRSSICMLTSAYPFCCSGSRTIFSCIGQANQKMAFRE